MDPSIPEGGWDSCCRSGSHRRFRAEPQGENRSSHLFQKTTSRKSQPSLGEYRRQYLEKPPEPAVARPNGGWRQSPSIAGQTSNSVGQPQDINLRAQGIHPEPVFSEPKGQTTFGPVPGKAAPRWNASRFEPGTCRIGERRLFSIGLRRPGGPSDPAIHSLRGIWPQAETLPWQPGHVTLLPYRTGFIGRTDRPGSVPRPH